MRRAVRAVRAVGAIDRHVRPEVEGAARQVRERGGHDLVAEMRRARQAACLGLVPAVRAGVLAAGHAEVERLVERVQLMRGLLAIGVAAGRCHRLVHRRLVGQDEVLQPARQDLDALEAGTRPRRFERVAGAAPFAEGFGQDLGHRVPGFARTTPVGGAPSKRFESIAHVLKRPSTVRTPLERRTSWVVVGRARRAPADPLVDSATDHAASSRHRAVLRTPLRATVRSTLPRPVAADPAPASDRARHGGANA